MQGYLPRNLQRLLAERLTQFPVVAVLGPRQCGKTTLVQQVFSGPADAVYMDLESRALENAIAALPDWRPSYYRTAEGAELDLVLERGRRRIAVECKASSAPTVSRGFWTALDDLEIREAWVVAPVGEPYPLREGMTVTSLPGFLRAVATQ